MNITGSIVFGSSLADGLVSFVLPTAGDLPPVDLEPDLDAGEPEPLPLAILPTKCDDVMTVTRKGNYRCLQRGHFFLQL